MIGVSLKEPGEMGGGAPKGMETKKFSEWDST